jgi:hypothetical protein
MASAQRLGLKTRRIIWWSLWVGGIASLIYSGYENFSPSEVLTEYVPFVWIPLGLGLFVFLLRKCFDHQAPIPVRKKIAVATLMLIAVLCFSKATICFGVPALLNRIAGEPFEVQSVVRKKSWNRALGPTLEVLNFETSWGKIWSSEPVWREVQRGDTVTLSGVQSVLGQSIDAVTGPKARVSETSEVASKSSGGLTDRTSTGVPSPKNTTHDNDLLRAIESGDVAMARVCLARGASPNASTRGEATALQCTAIKGDAGIIKLLLRKGANLDLKNDGGSTAFFLACAFGNLNAAELLAREGAKIDEPNLDGSTPLIIASLSGRTEVVKFLVENGASLNTRDSYGNTPLLAAERKSLRPQPDLVKLLEERGAVE